MIDKIYEVIANKELSFGCRVEIIDNDILSLRKIKPWYKPDICFYVWEFWEEIFITIRNIKIWDFKPFWIKRNELIKVTGHPIMIWDVLDWIDIKTKNSYFETLIKWKHKRLPIENQSPECIEYVYNLIK